ncbi:MAG: NAD(P)/FAD-dependent oxidoreductase, partial [Aeromicrobium sp.]
EKCAKKFDLEPNMRLRTEVLGATWDDVSQLWTIETTNGTWTAQILVGALGPFSEPSVPQLPGLEKFNGTVFHSTTWDHEHNLAGEKIAVIGTGASAVQFIPKIQQIAKELTVFQRTPTWILPHPDRPLGKRTKCLFRRFPVTQRLARRGFNLTQESLVPGFVYEPRLARILGVIGRAHLRHQVKDRTLRKKLTPTFAFGCKRPTFSSTYYPALAQPNVNVVSEGIHEVTERGIVTQDGVEHAFDTIIFGTGFRMSDHPGYELLAGRDGRTLSQTWDGDLRAYLGTTISNFPNFFVILGPNSVIYTSQVVTIESQVGYIMAALKAMDDRGLASIEVTAEAQDEFIARVDKRLKGSVWNSGGCSSYYVNEKGRNVAFWPGFAFTFVRKMKAIDLADYVTRTEGQV